MPKSLESGTYVLTNCSIALPIRPQYNNANSNIICQKNDFGDSYKWALEHISRNIYTIQNIGNSLFAYCSNNVLPPADVLVQVNSHYFKIDPVEGDADTYMIHTADSGVYLGLSESIPGAKVVVGMSGTAQLYQWVITKPMEAQNPGGASDVVESDRLIRFNPSTITNWVVKLAFTIEDGMEAMGSGFFVHIPNAKHDVILTAGHNLIMNGVRNRSMRVYLGNNTRIDVQESQYRISRSYETDEGKKEDNWGAILLPLDTFANLGMGYGFGYSLRLAEAHLKGEVHLTGYRPPASPGAPDESTGSFVDCKAKQLEYDAATEPGFGGSVIWMAYQGSPVAVGIHNYSDRGRDRKPINKGARMTLAMMGEVFAWSETEVWRLNHQLRATGRMSKAPPKSGDLKPLPSNGLFLYFPQGKGFAQVKRGFGSRFDVYPAQTNSVMDAKDRVARICIAIKDPWARQGKRKWVCFKHGAVIGVAWTESLTTDCLVQEVPTSRNLSSGKQLVLMVPGSDSSYSEQPVAIQLVMQREKIDDSEADGESNEALVVKYPSHPKTQYKELSFVP